MKRVTALLMLISLLLSGCGMLGEHMQEPVTFYYLEKEYVYGENGNVLAEELRETSGHRRDLSYLMALYLMGPTEEEHAMPLPAGTRIYSSVQENGTILLQLSAASNNLSDSEFTLACTCLAMTCFGFSDSEEVTIQNDERCISLNRSSITLSDNSSEYPNVEETQ